MGQIQNAISGGLTAAFGAAKVKKIAEAQDVATIEKLSPEIEDLRTTTQELNEERAAQDKMTEYAVGLDDSNPVKEQYIANLNKAEQELNARIDMKTLQAAKLQRRLELYKVSPELRKRAIAYASIATPDKEEGGKK